MRILTDCKERLRLMITVIAFVVEQYASSIAEIADNALFFMIVKEQNSFTPQAFNQLSLQLSE